MMDFNEGRILGRTIIEEKGRIGIAIKNLKT